MSKPVIVVFDVGKTNKKLFLFDEDYNIVFEKSARFIETTDEDGFPCENIESLRLSVYDSLSEIFRMNEFKVKAVNFSTYGASFVYIGDDGKPLTPLYNYLKEYPEDISNKFYTQYGGKDQLTLQTASPALGSLNSGLQLYRLKHEKPELFKRIKYALHLPQYMSYLFTGRPCSDLTSIGCHTGLWDFEKNRYHEWTQHEGIALKLAPILPANVAIPALFPGNNYKVGVGLHDSSAALIPYLFNFHEPFILISTGTWCISLNPFNQLPLTVDQLNNDCLCYLQYQGKPVKASRLFSGYEHEKQIKRIAANFNTNIIKYRNVQFDPGIVSYLKVREKSEINSSINNVFDNRELSEFRNDIHAYHQLVMDLVNQQIYSTQLVLKGTKVKRLFVDGGFSKNSVYMHLLAMAFPSIEVFSASMAQATAVGAALAIHKEWNRRPIPNDIIQLKYYSASQTISI
ncbi:FGGY-family carbohydrate kinase [Mucilaginibacter segetis]|uniref:Carbohydrate kinase n=1 Tax=Mucilaginibacter segetis TaxID=2793071 RepID=A0A934PQ67_9SPHI|nr:FGGY family carbohydrate kinase [Mucilaginibacter segetis]MBK0378723.1 carbohydrate kinase [Mucilaginibacter segetis]